MSGVVAQGPDRAVPIAFVAKVLQQVVGEAGDEALRLPALDGGLDRRGEGGDQGAHPADSAEGRYKVEGHVVVGISVKIAHRMFLSFGVLPLAGCWKPLLP